MHFIIDKNTREILHVNPSDPSVQRLEPIQIWSGFDEDLHDSCACEGRLHDLTGSPLDAHDALPDYFNLSADPIRSVTLQTMEELIANGHLPAPVGFKYIGDVRTEKTRAEKIADGEITIDDARAEKIATVESYYAGLIDRGCTFDARTFSCSTKVRSWLLGQKTVPKDAGWSLTWYTRDKQDQITLDETNLDQFLKTLADHYRTISAEKEQKITMIARAATITELDSTDWIAGWNLPATLPLE